MPNYPNTTKSWLDHQELMIVKGVYQAPADTITNEFRIDSIDLLNDKSGISLAPDGWTPQYPSLEGSGVWADSPLMVGRTPLVMTEGNVIEKMRLNITASSSNAMLGIKSKFSLFLRYARDFWTENYQIDPVYLHWFAACGGGPQYARIYNMEFDWDDQDSPQPITTLTLTIEREPYWLWLPPGANPKQWSYEWNSLRYQGPQTSVGVSPPTLIANINPLVAGAVSNKSEFATTITNPLVSDNAITIPAASIPGDAPALVEFWDDCNAGGISPRYCIIVGKKTTKIPAQSGSSGTLFIPQNVIFNAADGTLGTDATATADTGASKRQSDNLTRRVEISFATATNQLRYRITPSVASAVNSMIRFIGRWMVFMRCRQSSGTLGDITMYMRYSTAVTADTDGVKMNVVNPPITTGTTGNSTDWGLVYMGIVNIPFRPGTAPAQDIGNNNHTFGLDYGTMKFDLGLFALRSAGTGLLYLNDVIMIPIDEGSIQLETVDSGNYPGQFYDETGFLTHGTPDLFAACGSNVNTLGPDSITGTGIQLTPGVENRLYFLHYDTSKQSRVSDTFNVYLNIIPRSRGIRDRANLLG